MSKTYGSYLQLDKILSAQEPLTPNEHDETLFIIIHQVFELWFKQVMHEAKHFEELLLQENEQDAYYTLHRICLVLKTMVSQTDILETMTPLSFASFRTRLGTASGFQSHQFRIFELMLGKRNPKVLERYEKGTPEYQEIEDAIKAPPLYDCVLQFLHRKGFELPQSIIHRNYQVAYEPSESVEKVFERIYREHKNYIPLLERLVDLDEGLQEWRYRHVKMVERTIGAKPGTGGSLGVQYLKSTLFEPVFPELWTVRSLF